MDENNLQNKNYKHKFDVFYKILLRRWFLVQTFEEDDAELSQDTREIRELLHDENSDVGWLFVSDGNIILGLFVRIGPSSFKINKGNLPILERRQTWVI
jgi:hypothetical protein